MKRIVACFSAAAFALLLLNCAAHAQGEHDSARAGRLTRAQCRFEQLSVKHVSDDAAMGGARSITYALTNKSSSPCTLDGYPRFEVLSAAGRVVRGGRAKDGLSVLGDEAKAPPSPLMIQPGKAARFLVYYNAGGAGNMRPCPTYRRVRITAPGTARGFVLRESLQLCGDLQVSPVGSPAANEGR